MRRGSITDSQYAVSCCEKKSKNTDVPEKPYQEDMPCKGACTYDFFKNFGFFYPLPPLSLSRSHNLSVLSSAFGGPPSPSQSRHHMSMPPNKTTLRVLICAAGENAGTRTLSLFFRPPSPSPSYTTTSNLVTAGATLVVRGRGQQRTIKKGLDATSYNLILFSNRI